jgi:hypothetical protein
MSNFKRPAAFWIINVFLTFSIVMMLVGQTGAVFDYELAVRYGLQESPAEVGEYGVQVNRAFGASDTVVYIPLMTISVIGLFLRKRWALLTAAAVAGASAYWATTIFFMFIFLPGTIGYTLQPGPELWIFIGVYFLFGVFGLLYLVFKGGKLIQ